jgi:uncharacterized protein (DUF488 family)
VRRSKPYALVVTDGSLGLVATTTFYTVGHGTLAADAFESLLDGARISRVIDVRSFPGSRHNPQFGREEMERWLPEGGIDYVWIRELGGRRRSAGSSRHIALRNDAFRAYADYMYTPSFRAGIDELLTLVSRDPAAIMCSESVWWRCHRRLIADYLVLVRGISVVHLMHDGRRVTHVPTAGVRVAGDDLVYDIGATPPLI